MDVKLPLIGVTMGDPAGIGPEIATKALHRQEIYQICSPFVVGDANLMREACKIARVDVKVHPIADVREGTYSYGTIDVYDLGNVDVGRLIHKKVSTMGGKASLEYIYKVVDLAMAKQIDATVTGPIHKVAIAMAGSSYAGHTELYAHLTEAKDYAMMLVDGKFRVVHVTIHRALRDVPHLIRKDRVLKVIKLARQAMKDFNIKSPRIIVPGLNPHASDGGLFGDEEEKEIAPAVQEARREGIDVEGPVPPDTAFVKLKSGQYDVSLAMYHDQGHIPLKLLGFEWDKGSSQWKSISGVNVTLGLPIIRTSVDHGVAYDIAGEGKARPDSLIQAITLAAQLACGKRTSH